MGEVHAHLVRAAGLERQREQAGERFAPSRLRRIGLEHLVAGDGAPAAASADDGDLGAVGAAAGERRIDRPARPLRRAPDDRQIARARAGRRRRGRRIARRAPDARGRSWPPPAGRWCPCRGDARCPAASRRRCPRGSSPQWAISALTSVPEAWPGARMHGEALRLVDDDQVRRPRRRRRAGWPAARGRRARAPARRPRRSRRPSRCRPSPASAAPSRVHLAGADQRLQPRAAEVGEPPRQEAVEPLAGLRRGDGQEFVRVVARHPGRRPRCADR